ncbi:MAG: Gfo/Idh/MocA family oxidoreductase [Armatimonadetes bacterium]|nr:Gfo/Idh/MocA family oxidoreductase [Armatimonadota bacterium]
MPEPVRLAVVGASGSMGKARIRHFGDDPRCRVVAACARDIRRLGEAVPDEEIQLFAHAEEIYANPDVDAVSICIPNALHYEHARRALLAGKHVHCEYPLCQTLGEYDELVQLARDQGRVLHHALTVRAESLHRTMKGSLQGFGEPRAAYYRYYGGGGWYLDPNLRGDMFCALHIHFIDQFLDLFGEPEAITAHGIERDQCVSAVVLMQFPGGLAGTIEFGMGFIDKPGYMGTIVTADGWAGFESGSEGLTVKIGEGGQIGEMTPPPDTSKEEDAASFIDEILGTGGPQCDLATGRRAIELCLECSRQVG